MKLDDGKADEVHREVLESHAEEKFILSIQSYECMYMIEFQSGLGGIMEPPASLHSSLILLIRSSFP